jgi:serine/threonine protein kinase
MANELGGPEEHWPRLPPGLRVGDWRVLEPHGHGSYGVIYRAVRADQEDSGPFAFKLAVYPWDPRFAREVKLLSRIQHPGIPRLLDHGALCHVSGPEYPWFVMEWVDGTPLYSWAEQHAASLPQRLLVLAQVARALEAVHAAHATHRDVKGGNILVRHSDARAVLIDFGSCHFQGASRLTWQDLAPGTPVYRSPQASLVHIRSILEPNAYYEATAADDVFALGVTTYRLVMGEYPPPLEASQDEAFRWHVKSPDPRPFLERNPRVGPRLRELIRRMLSDAPEARGSAAELVEALESAAEEAAEPEAPGSTDSPPAHEPPEPVPPPVDGPSTDSRGRPERLGPRPLEWAWAPWLALAAAGLAAVLLWPSQPGHAPPGPGSVSAWDTSVGNSPPPPASARPSSERKPVAQSPLPKPRPGQLRPDRKGRCLSRKHLALNGGCWVEQSSMTAQECAESGYAYSQGKCYAPALESPQQPVPTSSPAEPR